MELEDFRCLRQVSFTCDRLTALVGANGTGKSSILKALEFFFDGRELDDLDAWGGDPSKEIRVTLLFAGLPEKLAQRLGPWLDEAGHLRLSRIAAPHTDGRRAYWYESVRRQIPEFQEVRRNESATQLRQAYNKLRKEPPFDDLPSVTRQADAETAMSSFEQAHLELCEPLADRSINLGGGGDLDLAGWFGFVLVPAVRDAAQDAVEGRTGSFRRLVELLVRTRLDIDEELERLRKELDAQYREIISRNGDTILAETSARLTERVNALAPGTAVRLHWAPSNNTVEPPRVYAEIVESEFAAEVGRQGHGAQRAYMLALLQELATARASMGQSGEDHPLLVLAIEEPELYQHPVRARYLAGVLHQLADGSGISDTQVFYATHSPFFVSVDAVQSIRLLRINARADDAPETSVTSTDLDAAAAELWEANGQPDGRWDANTLRARLRPMVETPVSEGFFASAVVLVEGEEDRAVVTAAAAVQGLDLDQRGIALLPVGGKRNLDRALVLFRQLEIPTYIVFDGDQNNRRNRDTNAKTNQALLRLLGQPQEFPETQARSKFACFENNLINTLRAEFGSGKVTAALHGACEHFGFSHDCGLKNSAVLRKALEDLASKGARSATLSSLISHIEALA
jgi:hypothetical protein